ncbi:MAG: histidine kinase [Bacteroidota bacterium]
MKLRIIICYLTFGLASCLHAQQPSYYRIGEKACAGLDLYSIVQDQDGDIWMSSNQGLLRYDGYTFHQYRSDELKSNSLFGLKKDREGIIYCNNLAGQFFRIAGDSLQLFAAVPDSLLSEFIEFNFDNENRLVFKTNHYYQINKQGVIRLLLEDPETTVKNIPLNDQDELILVDVTQDKLLYYKDDSFRIESSPDFDALPPTIRLFFNLKPNANRLILHGQRSPMIFEQEVEQWQPLRLQDFDSQELGWNTYVLSDGRIWLVSERNGSRVFDGQGNAYYQGVTLLPPYRISCLLEDVEGNLWLPTLGKGIIVIPNQSFVDYRNHPLLREDDIQSIAVDQRGTVYLGGISGTVYQVKEEAVSIFQKGAQKISYLHYIEKEDALVFGAKKIPLNTAQSTEISSPFEKAKSVIRIGPEQYLQASYGGVKFINGRSQFETSLGRYFKAFTHIDGSDPKGYSFSIGRTYALAWETSRQYIWAATNTGLKVVQPDTVVLKRFNGRPVHATSLSHKYGKIWVSTKNLGVLVYQQDSLIQHLNTQSGLLSNDIRKIIVKDNSLYLVSKAGLQIYDLTSRTFRNITQSDGLLSEFILDFAISEQVAWLVFQSGIQKIPLGNPNKERSELTLKMHQVLVNGEAVPFDQAGEFEYDQNEVAFEFMAKGHQHRGRLSYQYQLEGWKDEWLENSYRNNRVEYQSLPAGSYRFLIRTVDQNQYVSPLLEYSFVIRSPFWMRWWFYFLCVSMIVLVVMIVFKIRERIITERLQLESKLKMSEVTALKAQMNPHFIFNTLNSIQDLILMDDVRASNIYLGKFADLMRMLLSASGKEQIPVAQEIELLELYLEMERLRFGDEFTANIHSELSTDQLEAIEIPPLLIQPYIENAIKHGLLHKKGQKEVNVHFRLRSQALHCTITDNGIGRNKSAQIKARRARNHLSFATMANQKRIDLLNEAGQNKISISIQDVDPSRENSGTMVQLAFPLS